jgi:hypothetical protein
MMHEHLKILSTAWRKTGITKRKGMIAWGNVLLWCWRSSLDCCRIWSLHKFWSNSNDLKTRKGRRLLAVHPAVKALPVIIIVIQTLTWAATIALGISRIEMINTRWYHKWNRCGQLRSSQSYENGGLNL